MHPEIVKLVDKIPPRYGLVGLYGLVIYFLLDFIYTLVSVIELKSLVTEMRRLAAEARAKMEQIRESSVEGIEDTREELKARYDLIISQMAARNHRVLDAFPDLTNIRPDQIFKDIKERLSKISGQGK